MSNLGSALTKMTVPAGLVLFYHPYSFYSQKVTMVLKEKNIEYEPVIIDIIKGEQYSQSFLKINPRGEVPVLQDAGKNIPDSGRIIDYLEDNFSNGQNISLAPRNDLALKKKMEKFRNMIDALPAGIITVGSFFHPEFCENPKIPFLLPVRNVLKNAEMNSARNLRESAESNPESREVLLKKAANQEKKHAVVVDKDEYRKVLASVEEALDEVEKELASHTDDRPAWLCADEFTLADVSLTVLLVRLDRLGLDAYFWTRGKRKCVEAYYARVQNKESFKSSIPDVGVHLRVLLQSQPPLVIGVGLVGVLGAVVGVLYAIRRIVL